MPVTISAEDTRSIRAIELAAGASSWLKCRSKDGQRKAYGVPSRSRSGVYHLVDNQTCDCQDAKRHPGQPCMHVLAVRLHCELVKAQQPKPKTKAERPVLDMIREPDGSIRWERASRPRPVADASTYDRIFGRL